MPIEFNKLMEQVVKMGKMIEKLDFDLHDRLALATCIFESCNDLDTVHERIRWVRQPGISRYRGAAPLASEDAERVNRIVPPPPTPPAATILAVDG